MGACPPYEEVYLKDRLRETRVHPDSRAITLPAVVRRSNAALRNVSI